jgi:hypothetical protein
MLGTCIARATARAGDELSKPEVITQLWNDLAHIETLERHVVEVQDQDAESVARTVDSRWRAGELRI